MYVFVEVHRFNNNLGAKPLILIDEDNVDFSSKVGLVDKEYVGFGFTIEYEYNVKKEKNSDNIEVIVLGGEFKLFDKFMISAWIM